MFGAFTSFGKLGALASSVARAWSPSALWPTGTEAGMWIDPSNLTSQWQDSAGTTPVSPPGSVADSSNPVGLALDLRLGATVLTDPGNHLLQATSTARPLASARVNLLTYSEDFSNAAWERTGCTITANSTTAPDGTSTADSIVTAGGTPNIYQLSASLPATECTFSIYIKGTGNSIGKAITLMVWYIGTAIGTNTFSGETISGDWQRFDIQSTPATAGTVLFRLLDIGNGALADGDVVYAWGAQAIIGSNAGDYVAVPGAPYPSTGLPVYQKYDGTDDGMATASFAAGTLTSAMDCMIAVRRDSGANAVCGLYESVSDANKVFGIAESGSGSGCVGSGAGTPTVWVDGAQLTGGTAVTRGTLHTALSAGDWHILELRGLDLSTWTAAGSGLYTSYVLNGAQGGILLFPSSTSTADRDAARTWLGAKVGLTL